MYTYAFCFPLSAQIALPQGIVAPVEQLEESGLAAIVEPAVPLTELGETDQRLMAAVLSHDRVICDVFAYGPVLPLRFGTQFASVAALRSHLKTRAQRYRTALQALSDKAEYLLKLTPQASDYQPAQADQMRQLKAWLQVRYPNLVISPGADQVERFYFLLAPHQLADLKAVCETWQPQMHHWNFSLSPGLPPYHFVE